MAKQDHSTKASGNGKPTVVGQSDGITSLLVNYFKAWEPGREEPYSALEKVAGFDVWKKRAHLVRSARRIVQREHCVVIRCVAGVGLRCLNNDERSELPASGLSRSRKIAKTSSKVITTIDVNKLDADRRKQLDTCLAQLAAIQCVSSATVTRKLGSYERPDMRIVLSVVSED